MRFAKLEALGNDFILVERDARPERCDALARALCDRRRGIGADGLLVLLPGDGAADARLEVWNADGSEAETSGNGLRCAARWLAATRGRLSGGATAGAGAPGAPPLDLKIATRAGLAAIRATRDPSGAIRVPLGPPRFRPSEIPMIVPESDAAGGLGGRPAPGGGRVDVSVDRFVEGRLPGIPLPVTALSVGNPHAVIFVSGPIDAARLGPLVESHPAFPERANVEFVRVAALDRLIVLFWERGVGPTASSGTGAAAALVAAAVTERAARRARVEMEGGTLDVGWDEEGVWTAGPACVVFEGEWAE